MIKLKHILNETISRSIPIAKSSAIDKIKTFKQHSVINNFENVNFPFRGVDSTADFLYVKPSQHTRASSEGTNFYNILFSHLESWKSYPRRDRSIICSTDRLSARSFGDVFVVIPFDKNAIFGICPSVDLWASFNDICEGPYELDYMMIIIIDKLSSKLYGETVQSIKHFNDYAQLLNLFKLINNNAEITYDIIKGLSSNTPYKHLFVLTGRIIETFLKWDYSNEKIEDFLNNTFSPDKNGFSIQNLYTAKSLPDYKEVWTESESLLIRKEIFESEKLI